MGEDPFGSFFVRLSYPLWARTLNKGAPNNPARPASTHDPQSPIEDLCLLGPRPWQILRHDLQQIDFFGHPDPEQKYCA